MHVWKPPIVYLSVLVATHIIFWLFDIKAEEDILGSMATWPRDTVNFRKFDTLHAENVKLREELQKYTLFYTTLKCNIGQLIFLTGLTSVLFE